MRAALAALVVTAAACSSVDTRDSVDSTMPGAAQASEQATGQTTDPAPPTAITVPVTGEATIPLDSIAPPPAGVADVDADDALCRSLARVAGTSSLIGIAASFGGLDVDQLWRVEVIASPLLAESLAAADESVPPDADGDRPTLRATYLDARVARAVAINAALEAAGASPADMTTLSDLWLEVLRTDDQLDPQIAVPSLPMQLERMVQTAADDAAAQLDAFPGAAALVPIGPIPDIDAHLAAQCPEVAGLFVGDSI